MATALKDLYNRLSNIYTSLSPPTVPKTTANGGPLRLGILGAANHAPPGIVNPAKTHADVIVTAVAARSRAKAEAFAKKHGIPHVFDTYADLVADPGVDVVYNPLPVGLHCEWTLRCIAAGKHVLLEKPSAANEAETRAIAEAAQKANVLVLEAFHYRFHPALHEFAYRLHDFMAGNNPMTAVAADSVLPTGLFADTDIRFDWSVAGGALLDAGCYPVSAVLYTMRAAAGSWQRANWQEGIEVREARPTLFQPSSPSSKAHRNEKGDAAIDVAMEATVLVPTARPAKLPCRIETSLDRSFKLPLLGWRVPNLSRLTPSLKATFKDGSTVELHNFLLPFVWHSIKATYRGKSAAEAGVPEGTTKTYKAYVPGDTSGTDQMRRAAKDGHWPKGTGEPWWTTYRWQLEAFVLGVKAVKAGTPAHEVSPINMINEDRSSDSKRVPVWVQNEESVIIMQTIDAIYEKSGLAKRVSASRS